jgi:transcriptional regulator
MYLPTHFDEKDVAWAHAFIRATRAGTIVTHGANGIEANFIPLLLAEDGKKLLGHFARANPQAKNCGVGTNEALVIFQGANGYVSPSFYPSKAEHHQVVPTWNYEMVQVRGALTIHDDAQWLRAFLPQLTHMHEHARSEPWAMSDAPDEFIGNLLKHIVGVEIAITQIEAKRKLSQNRTEADRWGALAGLRESDEHAIADAMERAEK